MRKRGIFGLLLLVSLISLFIIPIVLAQDFGPFSPFNNVYQTSEPYNSYGSPISPFSVFSGTTTLTQIINSDWFSGLITFLIFFTIYLFLLSRFFKEVAVILSLLLAIASAAGLLIYVGPVIPLIGTWGLVIVILGILFGLFRNFRNYGRYLPITLLLVAIAWFIFRAYICGLTWVPYQFCPIMDSIAAIIVIIAGFYLLSRLARHLFNLLRIQGGGQTTRTESTGQNPPRVKLHARPGTITRGQSSTLTWSTRNARRVQITGIGNVGLSGSYPVMPNTTTVYRLVAIGDGGSAEAAVIVNVAGEERKEIEENKTEEKRKKEEYSIGQLQSAYRDIYMRIWNKKYSKSARMTFLDKLYQIKNELQRKGAKVPYDEPAKVQHKLEREGLI